MHMHSWLLGTYLFLLLMAVCKAYSARTASETCNICFAQHVHDQRSTTGGGACLTAVNHQPVHCRCQLRTRHRRRT